jgi:hypothetical protein
MLALPAPVANRFAVLDREVASRARRRPEPAGAGTGEPSKPGCDHPKKIKTTGRALPVVLEVYHKVGVVSPRQGRQTISPATSANYCKKLLK